MSSTGKAMTSKERSKKFRENNREKTREAAKAWYWRNREKVLAKKVEDRAREQEEQRKKDEELSRLRQLVAQYGIQV
ncbi:hypothetical protein GMAR_ORF85 [Golden Marseillevirus]|uniref:hypothetical protein n=1 Tax=Golden Marseillevirus TaxID=1720526 RepID=UPI000877AAEF|nr:hypothetical protein GMAR_ORF85 [Golden Marseillevirus]ALX27460.1 hypothetical protein GMAR_ORF85 [Golden Marseillevirus]